MAKKRASQRSPSRHTLLLKSVWLAVWVACAPSQNDASRDAGSSDSGVRLLPDDGGVKESAMDLRAWTTYLALGSSSTVGAGASVPQETGYVPLLYEALRAQAPDLRLDNRGQGGARVDHYLSFLDELVALDADVITILPLTDYVRTSAEDFEAGYTALVDALAARGAQIWLGDLRLDPALLCGVGSGPGGCYGAEDHDMLRAKNERLAAMAATRPALHIVAVYDQNVAHPEYIAADGHPNDAGHRFLADAFWAQIVQDTKVESP